jgi:hypothetical protein
MRVCVCWVQTQSSQRAYVCVGYNKTKPNARMCVVGTRTIWPTCEGGECRHKHNLTMCTRDTRKTKHNTLVRMLGTRPTVRMCVGREKNKTSPTSRMRWTPRGDPPAALGNILDQTSWEHLFGGVMDCFGRRGLSRMMPGQLRSNKLPTFVVLLKEMPVGWQMPRFLDLALSFAQFGKPCSLGEGFLAGRLCEGRT